MRGRLSLGRRSEKLASMSKDKGSSMAKKLQGNTSHKDKNRWLFLITSLFVIGAQIAILIIEWFRRTPQKQYAQSKQRGQNQPTNQQHHTTDQAIVRQPVEPNTKDEICALNSPNPIIKHLYLEITNIAQGVNIAILVYAITTRDFLTPLANGYLSGLLRAVTSLLIVIVFWTRYYLDTEILERSFTTLATSWFFIYITVQGISVSLINVPWAWLTSTGVFLLFGAGFYVLNLREIRRKQEAGVMPECPRFVIWQTKRMIEMFVLSPLALYGALLVVWQPVLTFPVAACVFVASIWQLEVTRDYRRLKFLETGV